MGQGPTGADQRGPTKRGARDQSLIQQIAIEDAKIRKIPIQGFTLDLTKAFNNFPRMPLALIFKRLGIEPRATDWWIRSLKELKRVPQLGQIYGEEIPSTTGVPEGGSLSVADMIGISIIFYAKLVNQKVQPSPMRTTGHGYPTTRNRMSEPW